MMGLVTERVLAELGVIRAVLGGEVPRSELTPMPSVVNEIDHRNKVALFMVTRLGVLMNRVNGVAGEMEGIIVALAGPNRQTNWEATMNQVRIFLEGGAGWVVLHVRSLLYISAFGGWTGLPENAACFDSEQQARAALSQEGLPADW